MKKLFIIISCLCVAFNGYAQDDDVYFVPKKNKKSNHIGVKQASYADYDYSSTDGMEYDTWAEGNHYSEEDIDAYNRRYQNFFYWIFHKYLAPLSNKYLCILNKKQNINHKIIVNNNTKCT